MSLLLFIQKDSGAGSKYLTTLSSWWHIFKAISMIKLQEQMTNQRVEQDLYLYTYLS
jgi:hypothetical protein